MDTTMQITRCETLENAFEITLSNGFECRYPFIWLRDQDPIGFHPQTEERLFDLTSVSIDIKPVDVQWSEASVTLIWPGEQQRSSFSAQWLANHLPHQSPSDVANIAPSHWYKDFLPQMPRFAADSLEEPQAMQNMLIELKRYGIAVITGLEDNEKSGELFGDRIGFKRETNFGVMFEVVNKPDPNNLAYTSVALPLHTDLCNQELPPGYQFLHCIANEAVGGESTLADGFAIAEDMKRESPENFELLTRQRVPFRFHDREVDIRREHFLIRQDGQGNVDKFTFNAHLAETPWLEPDELIAYYGAYQDLMARIRDPKYFVEMKLAAGEMMIFDNHRVMHGRNSFDPSTGYRHLRGYYIDKTEVNSKIRKLESQAAEKAVAA